MDYPAMPDVTPLPASELKGRLPVTTPLITRVTDLLKDYLKANPDRSNKVHEYCSPEEIEAAFTQAGTPLTLVEDGQPVSEEKLLRACEATLQYSVRTGHVLYFNQLYGRVDPVALMAEWLVAAAHCAVHTYEAAPVFTLVENHALDKLVSLWLGEDYQGKHDGLFVPGGSVANMYGLLMARSWKRPASRQRGLNGGAPLVAFTSAEAHYSYKKSAMVAGIGLDYLITVECDESGCMRMDALRQAVRDARERGEEPFFVGATAGTTVLGAYDDFVSIAKICEEEQMWFHVDGAWGGCAMMSPKLREECMQGAELANSMTWDGHKMLGMPHQCSAFLLRDDQEGRMQAANGCKADYLFQPDKLDSYNRLDIGDKTIQCGRRADAFKLWLAWKSRGDQGWAASVEYAWGLAKHLERRISDPSDNRFSMVAPSSCTNVCFWWVPPALRPKDGSKFDPRSADTQYSSLEALRLVAPRLKDRMQRGGDALIGFQPLLGLPNCFRMVLVSVDETRTEDLDAMLERMDTIGTQMFGDSLPGPLV